MHALCVLAPCRCVMHKWLTCYATYLSTIVGTACKQICMVAAWQKGAVSLCCCRFQFEPDALEVLVAGKEEQQTENAFVGGRNRWRYDTFINWELWWPNFPILVYFKVRTSG